MSETMAALGEGKSSSGKRPLSHELKALSVMDAQMEALGSTAARARAMMWLVYKWHLGDVVPGRSPAPADLPEGIENAG